MPHFRTDPDYGHEDDAAGTEEEGWNEDETFEVLIDANGNLWDGDGNLIQVSKEVGGDVNVTRRSPPSGIVQVDPKPLNSQTFSFNRGPVSGTGIEEIPEFGAGSFGSGMDQGSIVSLLTDAKNWFKDVSWGDVFGKVLSIAPTIYGLYQTHTQASIAEKAAEGNLELDTALRDKWTQDYNLSEPFKKSLYQALQSRIGAEAPPTLLPGKVPYVNPYRNKINIERGEEGTVSPEYGPGSTLRDAVRSSFFDRNPDAPLSHYIGQHPGAQGVRPGEFEEATAEAVAEAGDSEAVNHKWEDYGPDSYLQFDQSERMDGRSSGGNNNTGFDDWFRFSSEQANRPDKMGFDDWYQFADRQGGIGHEPHPTLEGRRNLNTDPYSYFNVGDAVQISASGDLPMHRFQEERGHLPINYRGRPIVPRG